MSQVTVTLTFSTVAEAAAFLAGGKAPAVSTVSMGNASSAEKPAAPAPDKAAAKATKPPAPAPKPSAPAAQDASTDSSSEGEGSPAGIDYETEVKPLVLKLSALPGGGRDAVLATLKAFGAPKGSDVKADKLPDFKAALEAKIAELEAKIAELEVA